jgi:hypothetical protein
MTGEYDSYCRVFNREGESIEWEMDWNEVCELMFHENQMNGIAAFHVDCFKNIDDFVALRSEDDPNQGWGPFQIDGEWFGCYNSDYWDEEEEN